MDLDSPNIGNIFLFYFSQTCLIKIIKSILPIVRANLEKVNIYSYLVFRCLNNKNKKCGQLGQ